MTHLTPDEFVDAVEGTLAADRQAHLAACTPCRRQVEELAALLGEAADAPVPEPSPLFWDQFSARVRQAIDLEPQPARGWRPAWFSLPVLVPVAGLALVVMALGMALPAPAPTPSALAATAEAPAPMDEVLDDDGSWQVVAGVLSTVDWETMREAGVTLAPGSAELAVASLSAEEQAELVRLLEAELARPES
ncbi:MAG: hypothetical protein AB7O67_14110 [Vicinamibacterales bacterium]